MRIFTLALLMIAILAPSANAQTEDLNWNQPRQDLEQLQRQYAPPTIIRPAPVVTYPTQIRQGLQQNSYINAAPLPTVTAPNGAILAPPRLLSPLPPAGYIHHYAPPLRLLSSPTLKETESRIVRRLCTEYKRGLTPGELDELARNLVEKNRRYLGDKAKNPYEYSVQARNTKKC
jgi:hypothetical protein